MSTNYPGGIVNFSTASIFGKLKLPDPSRNHTYFNDFDNFTAAEWVITKTDILATEAIADADGGVLLITNTAVDMGSVALQLAKETFKFVAGKPLYFKASFMVSDAVQSGLIFGLQIRDTTPLTVTDGVYFSKADGSSALNFQVVKNSIATTATAIATLVKDIYITVSFYYNGSDKIFYAASTNGNSPLAQGVVTTNLPDDEDLTISFALQNGEAAAKAMSVDYIFVSKERY